jgi:hypothetical protein
MRTVNHAAALTMVGWILATPALGQEDCLAAYRVNTTKSITYLAIGPSADDRISTKMSCSVADEMRDKLFLTSHTFNPNVLGNANQLRAKILEIKMRLANGKSELEAATTGATHLGAILGLKDTVLAAGLASAATGCIVSAATCKPAVGASVALYESGLDSNVGNITQASAEAQKQINVLDSMLQSIQAQINDSVAQQSKLRFGSVISAICNSIRQQCR